MSGSGRAGRIPWLNNEGAHALIPIVFAIVAATTSLRVFAQSEVSEVDVAMKFFREGGAYCFRLAPEGTTLSEEDEWTVMMLTGSVNRKNSYRIRGMDPGSTGVRGNALTNVGLAVTSIWRRDRVRDEFFEGFARAIAAGTMRARVVKIAPPRLTEMKAAERAELYLKFADRGSKVDFDRVPDLTVGEFLAFRTYVPD